MVATQVPHLVFHTLIVPSHDVVRQRSFSCRKRENTHVHRQHSHTKAQGDAQTNKAMLSTLTHKSTR